jgi:Phosphoinositide phospholipase C, Ca2+-dependent
VPTNPSVAVCIAVLSNAQPGQPDCAFTEQNEGSGEAIAALVRKGYLVRTRTDENTKEARSNDTARREVALASGAQLLSTDYPSAEPSSWTGYSVSLPDGAVARCNPVNAPPSCSNAEFTADKVASTRPLLTFQSPLVAQVEPRSSRE